MQNAYEGHSKENEIAETSTEEDVEYKSKDSERMACSRRAVFKGQSNECSL